MRAATGTSSRLLLDLAALVTTQYPDRPDVAIAAALRLLSAPGASTGVTVLEVRGVLLTRRALRILRTPRVPTGVNEARQLADTTGGGLLLLGTVEPAFVLLADGMLVDIQGSYRMEELEIPFRLLAGTATQGASTRTTIADLPYGLTGAYMVDRVHSPLSAARVLTAELGALRARMLERDVRSLEGAWLQLRNTA